MEATRRTKVGAAAAAAVNNDVIVDSSRQQSMQRYTLFTDCSSILFWMDE